VTFWSKLLTLFARETATATSTPRNHDRPTPEPDYCWAVPVTIADCGAITDGLHAYDQAIRAAEYGKPQGSPAARHRAARLAEQVGAAYARGYHLVPVEVAWLSDLENLLDDMLTHDASRCSPATAAYSDAVRRARVYSGMARIKGWAMNRQYGSAWLNSEPLLPPVATTRNDLTEGPQRP
jgi:hypothetical protein